MLQSYGMLSGVAPVLSFFVVLLAYLGLGFIGASLLWWTVFTAAVLWLFGFPAVVAVLVLTPLILLNIKPLRRTLISQNLVSFVKKLNALPAISETERVALEAGSTWVDKELFSGKPDFDKIFSEPYRSKLEGEELAFLNGPVEKVCAMVNDFSVFQNGDLPPEVWDYLKKERFFGLIVPKEYGGHGFSAALQSAVVGKLATRSQPLAVTVMVPNSLGPAELLAHYGTDEQKKHYLPRLARGEEIPCFALTEPNAGSDAGSITSGGEVFRGTDGKLYLKLNWNKRYITLAAVSTLIGLAVKLRDPGNLLGKGEDLGITCVLVPSSTKGVILGERHNPMGVPFYNCPTHGQDVVVAIDDHVIGGVDGVGRGWLMLMECLAAGRSISLPAQATVGTKGVLRVASAYATIRKQFGISIGKFEGIEEPLARIAGLSYLMEAGRVFTAGAVDKGIKPAVVSAIAKYLSTELGRKVINDGMDILGGAGISRGPRNLLANTYIAMPISITVEGANILTRSMIIFGQGAIRCHPYAYTVLKALMENDVKSFDDAFFRHIGHVLRNTCRSVLLSLTRGYLARTPGGVAAPYYRKLAWASASFSVMSDIALGSYGGSLKFREKITGRYADVLCWMYYATATLRRFEAEGQRADHRPYFEWAMQYAFYQMQEAFDGIFANIQAPGAHWFFRNVIGFWSRLNRFSSLPTDKLSHKMVTAISVPGELRDSLTDGVFLPRDVNEQMGRYENAFRLSHEADEIYRKVMKAVKTKKIAKGRGMALIERALEAGVITAEESGILTAAEEARNEAIQVDSFKLSEYDTGLMVPRDVKRVANAKTL